MDAEFLITVVLSSGVVAAVSSATIGAYLNLYRFKKESEAGFVQARAQLHSYLFFWLRIWLTRDIDIPISWQDFTTVDTHLSERLHLVSSNIQKEWLELHGLITERKFEDAVNIAKELVELIMREFNDKIMPKYEKYVGANIQKLAK